MWSAALAMSSCSQTRAEIQPALSRRASVSRSRCLLVSIFSRQNSALFFGQVACLGQPCQKQPSTKTATRDGVKTMSGLRRLPDNTKRSIRNRKPRRCKMRRSSTSGLVSRLPVRAMRALTAGDCASIPTLSGPRKVLRRLAFGSLEARRGPAAGSSPRGVLPLRKSGLSGCGENLLKLV